MATLRVTSSRTLPRASRHESPIAIIVEAECECECSYVHGSVSVYDMLRQLDAACGTHFAKREWFADGPCQWVGHTTPNLDWHGGVSWTFNVIGGK